MVIKVGISACTGFDYPEAPLTRMIGYRVLEDLRPDETVLICLPALAADVEEDIEFGEKYPIIVIEGCDKLCCTRIFEEKKLAHNIRHTYNIQELIKAIPDLQISSSALLTSAPQVSLEIQTFIDKTAEIIAQDIDKLIKEENE